MNTVVILYKGPCCYAVRGRDGLYDVVVHSTNYVTHVTAASGIGGDRAEQICRRLNAYERITRRAYGLT